LTVMAFLIYFFQIHRLNLAFFNVERVHKLRNAMVMGNVLSQVTLQTKE